LVTDQELQELLADCPVLYHMAEAGSWPSIRKHGLLSTSALLDLCGVTGAARKEIEKQRRPESVVIQHPILGRVVIRDNKPMDDKGLVRSLEGGLAPREWYALLNARVFFWLTRDRLLRLLGAAAYGAQAHDVLEVDSESLVRAHREKITLSPMNSGATKPIPHPRGPSTFLSIAEYPYSYWRSRRPRGERVVELAVSPGVPDIKRFVQRVVRMQGSQELETVYQRS
jgi:hypothetical protein